MKDQNVLLSRLISSKVLSSSGGVMIAASPCPFAMLYVGVMGSRRLQSSKAVVCRWYLRTSFERREICWHHMLNSNRLSVHV